MPIVYCETNWIVALAFPHHQLHKGAKDLLTRAENGECSLRIPQASLLEARGTLGDVANQLSASFAALRNDLVNAATNGLPQFAGIAAALQSDEVDKYAQRDVLPLLDDLEHNTAVNILEDVTANFEVLRELRPQVGFRGKDVVDLHLLAAVIKDRRENLGSPALLMSHNKNEFDPKKSKVPAELYEDCKLLWRQDFDLATGLGQWSAKYGSS